MLTIHYPAPNRHDTLQGMAQYGKGYAKNGGHVKMYMSAVMLIAERYGHVCFYNFIILHLHLKIILFPIIVISHCRYI